MIARPVGFIAMLGMVAGFGCAPDAHGDGRILLVVGAKIWTADADRPEASALVVRGGRFFYVGDEATARRKAGPNADCLDAGGRRIVPGLIDSHVHLIDGGRSLSRLDLRSATSLDEFVMRVRADVKQRRLKDDHWLIGRGWSADSWPQASMPLSRGLIDFMQGGRILLYRMDGHCALANTRALDAAGLLRPDIVDPPGGVIERDPKTGYPTGILKDTAIDLVANCIPKPTDAELDAGLAAAMKHANAHGLTGVHTMSEYAHLAVFDRARERGTLTLRIRHYISETDWSAFIDRAKAHRNDDWVRVVGFKAYADGSLGSRTAFMREPYRDNAPDKQDWRGLLIDIADDKAFSAECTAALEHGLLPAVHSIGDEANDRVLRLLGSCCKAAKRVSRKRTMNAGFPRIEHAQHLLPEDIAQFARLGVVASMQPLHKADDARYAEKAIGPERCKSSYAYRSLLDAGALVAFGSDWPVVSLDPFLGVRVAATGLTVEGGVFVPEQNITIEEALACYTRNAARAAGDEALLGMIRAGMAADFVILKVDPLAADSATLNDECVDRTFVNGRCVYSSDVAVGAIGG